MRHVRDEKSRQQHATRRSSTAIRFENLGFLQTEGRGNEAEAFTRTELVVVLGVVALLGMLTVPLLAGNRARSDRVVCQSNLRQIGQAFRMWADDHGGNYAYRTPRSEGGNNDIVLCNNVWFQYYWLSNELRTPTILACPSDTKKLPALDWSNSPYRGFNHANGRNTHCSYLLTLGIMQAPRGILSADRNVRFGSIVGGCSAGSLYSGVATLDSNSAEWTQGLHDYSGNMVLNDGSVIAADRAELRTAIRDATVPDGRLCTLDPY